ncbi:MAG: polyprenyl synthetase family protein [Oscillospiraceae bacterium]|nr:polyprenyl synthetase family protein [Oscillospiraceae bacterium]
MQMKFREQTGLYREYVEKFMQDWYARFHDEPQKQLFEAMEYSLLAGGKRLRPIFAFEFCRICGADWQAAAPFAAAVEMIHTYSLIHDDLPSMDNDDLRRGRPTNHKVYGEAMAILAGDSLLTDAFAVAATAQLAQPQDMAFAISVLSECAGSLGMVGGQVLDICSEERECTEEEILNIQSRKTGALINAACVLGVIAAGGTEEQIDAAASFAGALGIAFQIRDDMLDVIGTRDEMGKGVGTDAEKNTFVQLYGLQKCEELVQKYTRVALDALDAFEDPGILPELAASLTDRRN